MAADGAGPNRPLLVSVIGTRPEAIKMAPVLRALNNRTDLAQALILTGQHAGLEAFLADVPVPRLPLVLNLAEQTAGEIRDRLRDALTFALLRLRPRLVLVQGDTTSALAGALAARDLGIPVAHVEAGLRSGDTQMPWPEEGNRIRIDRLSDILFAPTEGNAANLRREEVAGAVHVTGNSGIDALLAAARAGPELAGEGRRTILVTCHRRENWHALEQVAAALRRLAAELPVEIRFLLHSNPALQRAAIELLGGVPGIRLQEPVTHGEMVALLSRAWLILSDSGGLQEEAPALGRPLLVLRDVTERPEALDCAGIELVGTDPERIVAAVRRLHEEPGRHAEMARPRFPFGDGEAAPRIAAVIGEYLSGKETLQPPPSARVIG